VQALGLAAEPISAAVEARELDDWRGKNPMQSLELSMKTFGDRAALEVEDLRGAVAAVGPDVLCVDTNSWGAQAVAEASGLPWVVFQPYFTALPARGVPPFGPGLPRSDTPFGRLRDTILGKLIYSKMNQFALPPINAARAQVGLQQLASMGELFARPPRVLYFTAPALEYPRERWPENFRFVGPGTWAPPSTIPQWLEEVDRPIALVTCSTELQRDRGILEAALAGLPEAGYFVAATSGAYTPEEVEVPATRNVRLERFMSHDPVIEQAEVVVCHGGMGITQRALSRGVPVVVVPHGRDQLEVGRRVENAGAGVMLSAKKLSAETLTAAARSAGSMREGAGRAARALADTGGSPAAAAAIEELLNERRVDPVDPVGNRQ
jgi:MGT family glycosyltransferase